MAAEIAFSRLLRLLEDLADLLSVAGQEAWSRRLETIRSTLNEAPGDYHREQAAVRGILSLYGGMGSFQDLVLQDARGVRPEHEEFDQLRDQLFEEARAALR
ncbi:MAG TPA: hypothetical protein VNF47_19170 [Streptosporangiaceae bacterium]|nr:hypothetical protein [Streptosporangiaceae bacterium]